MTSLRKLLTARITILVVMIGLSASVMAYFLVRMELNSFQDNQLREVALNAGPTFRHDGHPRIDVEQEDLLVIQIWEHDGRLIHWSGPEQNIPMQPGLGYFNVTAGGERWRVFRLQDAKHAVQVSQRWSAREEVATHAAAGAVVPVALAVPLTWLLIGWTIRRVLAGLGRLSTDIGRRGADASEKLNTGEVPDEIVPLVDAMNSLIERHQQALEAQRRFVADAAHELRTPLAALQIQIDNLRAQAIDGAARETAADLLEGIRRATHSVHQLLTLTRADASMAHTPEATRSAILVEMAASGVTAIAASKGVRLAIDANEDVPLIANASQIQLVLSCLLDNAVRYTARGGDIGIAARKSGDGVTIVITDSGCGIPEAALPHIYDRFFRAAPPDIEGTGLGLAIARTVADRNGMRLEIRNRIDGHGVIAELVIPPASPVAG